MQFLLLGSGGIVCFATACAEIFGVHQADTGDAASVVDGGVDAADVQPDYIVFDQFQVDVNTAVCDGAVAAVDGALWVSGHGVTTNAADDNTCGTPDHPCATINHALANRLGAFPTRTVYVDDSTFYESISIGSTYGGLTLQGGWQLVDGGWVPQCDSSLSKIYAPDAATQAGTVWLHDMDAGVVLRLLEVQSKGTANKGSGESLYAIVITNTQGVTLDSVTMIAQGGAQGTQGAPGQPGTSCQHGLSGTGNSGGVGSPGAGGSFDQNGYTPKVAGAGTPGDRGTSSPGTSGACGTCTVQCQ